jgi:hypothetical protein
VYAPGVSDLHPKHGGRFVMTRRGDAMEYAVDVYLPEGVHHHAVLRWTDAGHAVVEPPIADIWAHEEALKLARVLHQNPKASLSRWRGR